jgi:hypothetical protein
MMRTLSAYYFSQHTFTLVPRHVREDMAWMAGIGTNAVCVAVLEQDVGIARSNFGTICREAERAGMEVYAVPSRWGGLLAGAPKVPSLFAASHPETWMLDEEGKPRFFFGPMCSVHHPGTFEFFRNMIDSMLAAWPMKGIIWDEPKALNVTDASPLARKSAPPGAGLAWHIDRFADFFDRLGAHVRAKHPQVRLAMFLYSHLTGHPVEACSRIENLDDFGCDGRPWSLAKDGIAAKTSESREKALIDHAPRFVEAARKAGKRPLILIENHDMEPEYFDLMDRRLPDVLSLGAEHVLYYYYPMQHGEGDADRQMAILSRHLSSWIR